jgi:FAD:protein FMN transferase
MRRQVLLFISLTALLAASCTAPRQVRHKRQFFRMDTITEVTVVASARRDMAPVWRAVDSLLRSWEERFSVERSGSEVFALNASPDTVVPVSPELARMVQFAVRYGDTLDGGFDITILPLKRLWSLDERVQGSVSQHMPSDSAMREALEQVDYRRVSAQRSPPVVIRPPGVLIDVGGIAKGAAIQAVSELLAEMDFVNYLISAGGDIAVEGTRGDGTPWIIAVRHPRREEQFLATMRLDSGCIVTSGDYERYWLTPEGERVHHIFSPASGRSCLANRSLTIWSRDPVEADVLSTGLFCRPADSVVAFVQARPRLECIVVDSTGRTLVSDGWRDRVQIK